MQLRDQPYIMEQTSEWTFLKVHILLKIWASNKYVNDKGGQCTEVRFASFFYAAIIVNPPKKKLSKRISVQWVKEMGIWVGNKNIHV